MMRIPGRTRLETVAGIVLALGLFAACGGSSSTAQDVVTPDVVGDTADVPTVDTPADTPVDIPPDTLIDTPVDTPVDVPTDTPVDPGPPPATTWTDPDTGLVWQDPPNADQLMKSAAIDYCANLTLDGHDDWRLPTISELRGLVRGCEDALTGGACGITDECLQESCKVAGTCSGCDSLQGPGTAGCYRVSALTGSCDIYWASSDDQTDGGRGWFVNFSLGKVDFDGGGNVHGVRCVRGGVEKLNPPAISAPLADAVVSSPIHVTGTAQPNAVLAAKILNGVTQIGAGGANANGTGAFDFTVAYTDAAADAALTLSVTQTVDVRTSAAATVALKQAGVVLHTLGGTIGQSGGGQNGTVVKVRLYANATEAVQYLQEAVLTVADAAFVDGAAYSFQVPNGTYTVRAFRDESGPLVGGPDGEPTLGPDPQAPGLDVTVIDADLPGQNLVLEDTGSISRFGGFGVTANNVTAFPQPPFYFPGGGSSIPGTGLCGGYYLALTGGSPFGQTADLTAPAVVLPSGVRRTLLDDGGCGEAVHDNTNHSFDFQAGDNQFSLGIPDPGAADAGKYTFYYRNTVKNMIENQVRDLAQVIKLSRLAYLTSPTGAAHVATLNPTFTWNAIPDATAYSFCINSKTFSKCYETSTNSFTVSEDSLPDVAAFDVRIGARVEAGTGNFVATAQGVDNFFVTDVAGTHLVTLAGTIVNDSGKTGNVLVYGLGTSPQLGYQPSFEASVVLSSGTTFSLEVLKPSDCSYDSNQNGVLAFIDADGTGDPQAQGSLFVNLNNLPNCSNNTGLEAIIRPTIKVSYPLAGATGVGNTPTVTWEAYDTTYLAATGHTLDMSNKSYVFVLQVPDSSAPLPPLAYGLPSSATSLNLASLPSAKVDLVQILSGGSSSNVADLSSNPQWNLFLALVPCTYGDSGQGLTDFTTCLQGLLGSNGISNFAHTPDKLNFSTN